MPFSKFPSLSYTPVTDFSDSVDNVDIYDELSVYHSESLSIPGGGSDTYTIESISDYSDKELTYDMTIYSTVETINFEIAENNFLIPDNNIHDLKQAFLFCSSRSFYHNE